MIRIIWGNNLVVHTGAKRQWHEAPTGIEQHLGVTPVCAYRQIQCFAGLKE